MCKNKTHNKEKSFTWLTLEQSSRNNLQSFELAESKKVSTEFSEICENCRVSLHRVTSTFNIGNDRLGMRLHNLTISVHVHVHVNTNIQDPTHSREYCKTGPWSSRTFNTERSSPCFITTYRAVFFTIDNLYNIYFLLIVLLKPPSAGNSRQSVYAPFIDLPY